MFEPLNALERLLIAAATDASARPAFVQAFLESEVYYSPAGDPPKDGTLGQIVIAFMADGGSAAALFTARERIAEVVGPDARTAAITGAEALQKLRGGAVQVNPNCVPSVIWSAEDIAEMLGTGRDQIVARDTQILLSHPAQLPTELIARLATGLSKLDQVKGAWMLQAHRSDQPEPVWLLGVQHTKNWAEVDQAIAAAVLGLPAGEKPLQAVSLAKDQLSEQLRKGIPVVAPKRGLLDIFKD